ncbi:MAG: phosphoglycerate kinase [Bacteroidota bacterium]|jgi:phosphoglycerate kinase
MKNLDQFNFQNQKVLIRVDFNVPLDKELKVTDDTRIKAAIPTIKKILLDGGSVILMSHLGRPLKKLNEDGTINYKKHSLENITSTVEQLLGHQVNFVDSCIGPNAMAAAAALNPGSVLLLENLRFHKEEEKGDVKFAKELSQLADFYVNDAFGTAHRAHASTAIIAQFFTNKKCFGYVMANEIENANKILSNSQKPFTAIMGGAKVSDKILIIENLIPQADHIIIGGGMAYTFFKALGGNIGDSLVEEDKLQLALALLEKAKAHNCQIHLPADSVVADQFDAAANTKNANNIDIPQGWMGLDIGPLAMHEFGTIIANSKTILWNGPMGVFEMQKFEQGTRTIAQAVAHATAAGAYSLIGGGDSAAAVNQFGYAQKVSYISTGGGALLEYMEGKILPGVKAIMG